MSRELRIWATVTLAALGSPRAAFPAWGEADGKDMGVCAARTDDKERLACFDAAIKRAQSGAGQNSSSPDEPNASTKEVIAKEKPK